jgi:hypothetical protein
VSRVSLSVAFLLLAFPARAFGEPASEPFDLQCFDDGTLVSETFRFGLSMLKGGRWQALAPEGGILRLWRSPDDRIFATGRLLGRREGAALRGSTCLDGKRALLVDKRGIQIVSVPGLRRLWRQRRDSAIGAVAVCHGGTRAMIVPTEKPDAVEELDLTGPAMFGKAELARRGTHVVP